MQTSQIKKGSNRHVVYAATNPIVTNQAMEFFQSQDGFVAVRDVPLIKVPAASGKLAIVSQEYINRDEVAKRSSAAAEAQKGTLGVSTVDYTTDTRALEYLLTAADAAAIGYEYGADVPSLIPRALAMKGNIHTESRMAALWASGSWYRTVSGNSTDSGSEGTTTMNRIYWSDHTKDPVKGIFAEKRIFLLRTGQMPTNLRMGYKAFESLATNPYVRQQILGGSVAAVMMLPIATEAQLSALLGLKVSVSWGVKNTSDIDGSPSNSFIVTPEDALMTYDAPGEFSATENASGPPSVTLGSSTGFARVAWEGVAPGGFQIRGPLERETVGAGGSRSWILDLYQGFVIVDSKFGTFFDGISQ